MLNAFKSNQPNHTPNRNFQSSLKHQTQVVEPYVILKFNSDSERLQKLKSQSLFLWIIYSFLVWYFKCHEVDYTFYNSIPNNSWVGCDCYERKPSNPRTRRRIAIKDRIPGINTNNSAFSGFTKTLQSKDLEIEFVLG